MITLFDGAYEEVGDSSSNLILNTRGCIKIRYGDSYRNLLNSDGKLNLDLIDIQSLKNKLGLE